LETRVPARLTLAEGRRFGIVVGCALLALGGVARWRAHAVSSTLLLALGGTLVAAGLIIPGRLGPVQRLWMKGGLAISRVTTPIAMALIYFLVLTPIGLILRVVGHRPLSHGRGSRTALVSRGPQRGGRSDLTRQF
jgi:hypothetical protein